MNRKILTLAICNMALVGYGNCSSKISSILGDWSGVLDVGIAKFTLVLHLRQNPDGALSATVDTLEQKVNGTLIDRVAFDEGSLTFEIKAALAKFEGLLIKNESEISGQWTQAGQSFPLAFERGVKSVEGPNRPQEPNRPFPYTEEYISYDNLEAGVTLSGTLTYPASKGPFPVVILIAGSGPIDRDETVWGHKPFLVLADYLTRQGIAVLRFDKRGCGKSTGNYDKATTQDFADDVLAGIAYIKARKEVNLNQIGLIGHSEGGIIAPMVAARSKDIEFVVLMAGTGVNGEEILYEQSALIQRAVGAAEDTINRSRKFQEQMFTLVKREPDPQIVAEQLREISKNYNTTLPGTQEKVTLEYLERVASRINTDWFRYYLTFDPSATLKRVRVPVLVLNGELDLQVSSKQNLPVISKALEESGNKDFTIIELPKLNHFFQTCETGAIAEYAEIEETISPSVLKLITEWILERTVKNKKNIDG